MTIHDCVGALIVRPGAAGGEVLLGRRAEDCAWLPGAWDVFGGHLEPGETAARALARELGEELGIVPLRSRHLETLAGGGADSWRLALYAVDAWRGTPRNRQPREHAEIRWCTLAQAQALLAPAHPDFPRLLAAAMV